MDTLASLGSSQRPFVVLYIVEQLTLAGAVSGRMPRCDLHPDLENRIELEAGEGNDWRESREKS